MKRMIIISAAAGSLALSACATDQYGYRDNQTNRAVKGAAIGGAVGAATGAIVGGVNPIEGAIAGALIGGVAGAVIKGKQYYRDTRGYCYYVDNNGNPVYDYNTKC